MSRFTATFYHFIISLAVFVFLAYLIVIVWYPDFFYTIDGGWEGMRIIIGVDLVLGPLLTLIVFKAGKPGLKFDLVTIALFQASCLLAGIYVVYNERPLFFVYYEDHFYSASGDTFLRYNQLVPDPSEFSDTSPAMVIAKLPDNPIEEANLRSILFKDGIPLWVYKPSYELLENHMDQVMEGEISLDAIRERDTKGELDRWLTAHGGAPEAYAFFPIHARYGSNFIAVRKSDREFIDIVNIPAPISFAD
ncbi:MAG: hypothetical protein HOC70_04980 [Gammaproteobacteria bacterium]|jgi:hypothetical protein|nr:hypothetical protein [Gammaproteobacteria bacterium]MBT4492577.1 hypothetical protein [Gammaproteobacteria bacterium]MBT7370584.1 hypothetical protein [Gammaproteobacteria bacterium]